MEKRLNHLIKAANAKILQVTNPSTGETIAEVGCSTPEDVQYALNCTSGIQNGKSKILPLARRIEIFEALITLMGTQSTRLAEAIAREGGKPLTDAIVEVNRATQGVKKCIEAISTEAGSVIPMGMYPNSSKRIAFTRKEPIGTVLAISAFNHPLNLIVHQVGAAIAAGCPCIVKPAQDTPLSCLNFYDLLIEAGLPKEYLHVVITTDLALAGQLVQSSEIQFLSFIGSAKVGWMLRQQVQPGVRCALEHGGAAPAFVTAHADLETAAKSISKGGFYHAGQVCVSTQRVYIEESVLENFVEILQTQVENLVVGDAIQLDTEVGPLIREQEVDRVEAWVKEAIDQGAQKICGGARINERFFAPTLLLNPPKTANVSSQEIFGPVVCLYGYDLFEAAIQEANNLDVAFQSAIYSTNLEECIQFHQEIKSSAVMVNDHTAYREDSMPFAGLKHSGLAVGGIQHSIRDMQIEKMMVIHSPNIQ